ncbi:OmpA family protein [Methylobacterium symbioticum]|uniref:Outer membrane protein A n=1 Tax=Methylobacterium symbioticum TaxID=2584084 RepID=A0A509EM05_9HYPH|nr:OmpA family protein [Methylobacterium symbioticum]VUD75012.1 Outer membrane protein A [Methylobacterium symbioticum]
MRHSVRHFAFLAPLALAAATGAQADPAYKASDIVAHFAPATQPGLGGTRALCIGTESECGKAVQDRSKPVDGFDLRVNFDYNSANLTPAARQNLDEFARALNDPALSNAQFVVEGHTDGMGSDAFNLDLSMRRARSVVDFLKTHGVSDARIEAKGYGKQKPLVQDPLSSQNRRVETRLKTD